METSVFGADLMMGIPILGLLYIYGENMSVVHNTSRPEFVLRKESNSGCYHEICESVAMGKFIFPAVKMLQV